jgi:autotransporter-associated beta strand protein
MGTGALNFSGGTLQIPPNYSTNTQIVLVAGGSGTIDTNGNNMAISGSWLTGPGGFQKGGAGILSLTGSSTYTGATTVNSGTLTILGNISSSSLTANSGATLLLNGVTISLNTGLIRAAAGGSVLYQNATINGGFIRGPGTHQTLAGTSNVFAGTTSYASTVLQQNGTDTFVNFTNGGQVMNNAPLVWDGGENNLGGSLTVNSTVSTDDFVNAGVIAIASSGALNNHLSDMTSGGGGRITVNSGGTLNADSQSEGVALDLQDSLLVNNGKITGTTNVYYGATVSGSGSFGPINVYSGGIVAFSPSAAPVAAGVVVSGGSMGGSGSTPQAATINTAYLVAPLAADLIVFSGNLSGSGAVTKLGAGTVVLSGTNTYLGGTNVPEGTLIISSSAAVCDGTDLSVGAAAEAMFAPTVPGEQAAIAVPEPSTLALLAVVVSGLATRSFAARPRRKARRP